MVRKSDLLWLGVAAFAGVALFHTSYRVQGLKEALSVLDRQITSEQDGIQVLKAEWSFLNDPARLEQLAATYLTLKPITATQVATFDVLPPRPAIQSVSVPAGPPVINLAAPKRITQATLASAPQERSAPAQRPVGVTLASVSVPDSVSLPVQPHVQAHKVTRTIRPAAGTRVAAVTTRSTAAYVPVHDEIGSLLNRLGRVQ